MPLAGPHAQPIFPAPVQVLDLISESLELKPLAHPNADLTLRALV